MAAKHAMTPRQVDKMYVAEIAEILQKDAEASASDRLVGEPELQPAHKPPVPVSENYQREIADSRMTTFGDRSSGLVTFDLCAAFACATDLAKATADYRPDDYAELLGAQSNPGADVNLELQIRWHEALDAILNESNRLKRVLGATGPLDAADCLRERSTQSTWEAFESQFKYAGHPPMIRQALWKLANAAVDLSGYASVRVQDQSMRERGLRLLRQGLSQLWEGMDGNSRTEVRALLVQTSSALGWPAVSTQEPPSYDGPNELGDADRRRIIDEAAGFIAVSREELDGQQNTAIRLCLRRRPSRHPGQGNQSDSNQTTVRQTNAELVRKFLDAHKNARVEEVTQATGLTEQKVRRTREWKAHEESQLHEFLQTHPDATTTDVERIFCFSPQKTVGMAAWKAHMTRKAAVKPPSTIKERPLTDDIARNRPDNTSQDPSDVPALRDSIFRLLIENCDPKTKSDLHRLSAPDREELIDHLLEQVEVDGPKSPQGSQAVEIMVELTKSWLDDREQDRRRDSHNRTPR
jgi:hypothetical protein